ncbi:cysteine-tRNA ligase, cytoplasmic-like protein [Sarcoptes scabiei]|uniref:Cysteine--tRNA ligase, cytoplasmic n=1 Tax=Sarcoptes scabiei TaxID=52283 RepID=A0A132A719_SARSC|nr:cysteine-tRNA ligase, cytoplasmic-like protein [Sarcoptes scabiei]
MSEKRKQKEWNLPERDAIHSKIELYNSLTRDKKEFVPIESNLIKWYNCGPTVYDSSHMGHARSYITFDIIRRVLQDYFHFDIFFVQNITDIDDKIIRRARQNHLFDRYLEELGTKSKDQIQNDIEEALKSMQTKHDDEKDQEKKLMYAKLIENAKIHLANGLQQSDSKVFCSNFKDILSVWLDQQYGHQINEREIFISLPRFYEKEFNDDMNSLNILPPDCVTRVSEYVPEIVDFIEKIVQNGYAYQSNGSVYFDTEKFANDPKHFYAKLVPEAFGDCKALSEGEGDLSVDDEKRSPNDFALWKNSKPGEPFWSSPWGNGRPGWHIECSVMASCIIGKQMDIHSGGIDLRFPHHDNEMAQSEAFYNSGEPWVNYFLHSGHLTISGCKMSKSLKNFITIKEALKRNSARQLRIAFLMHSWKDTLDYSDNTMNDAIQFEKTLNEFFLTVKDILRSGVSKSDQDTIKWNKEELDLHRKFLDHRIRIDQALRDNIDTKKCLEEIRRLISSYNVYIQAKQNEADGLLLIQTAQYISKLMNVFGCSGWIDGLNYALLLRNSTTTNQTIDVCDREQIVMPFIQSIAKLRDEIRAIAKNFKNKQLFELCDRIRDDILPELGVRMEDFTTADNQQQWRLKLIDRETLMKEREKRLKTLEQMKLETAANKSKQQQSSKQIESPPIDPKEMFRAETDKYSRFDSQGIPTHDQNGEELTKSAIKKLLKRYQIQEKKYQSYLTNQNSEQNP